MNIVNMGNFVFWSITGSFFNFATSAINTYLFLKLLGVNYTKKKNVLMILTCGGIRSILFIFLPFPYYIVANLIIEVALLKLIYKEKIEKCIVGEFINYITEVIIELFFATVFLRIFNNQDNYISAIYSCKYLICLYSCSLVARVITCIIVDKKAWSFNLDSNLSRKDKNIIIACSMIACLIIYSASVELLYSINTLQYRIIVLCIFSMVMYFYISVQQIIKIININQSSQKISELESYNKTLSIMYDNVRGFKHDFSNLVQALDGYAKTGDLEGIKNMTGSIISDCKSINNLEILNSSLINNPAIYSIITSKYYLAQRENVDMNIEISADLSETKNCSYEISRILAILLDNAIEAAKECDEKIVNFKCITDPNVNRKLVIIENTYKEKGIDIERIFEKGYTIKEDKNNEHGLGLWTVQNTLRKLDNINLFTTKGEHFCQQLEIYNN